MKMLLKVFFSLLTLSHICDCVRSVSNLYKRSDSLPVSSESLLTITSFQSSLLMHCLLRCQSDDCDVAHYEDGICTLYESLEKIPLPVDGDRTGRYHIRDYHLPLEQRPEDYRAFQGYHLGEGITNTPNTVQTGGITTVRECLEKCQEEFAEDCNMFSLQRDSEVCLMTALDFYTSWTVFEPRNRTISYFKYRPDGYKMLYRRPKSSHLSGFDRQVTDPWEDDSYEHTYFDSAASLTATLNDVVAKNTMANYWELLSVNMVRLGIYAGGEEKRYAEFDGIDSTRTNWIALDKLRGSSWSDFTADQTVLDCSFESGTYSRGFYMVRSHGGCPNDYIWFVAIDRASPTKCDWERVAWNDTTTPQLLYATGDNAIDGDLAAAADLIMISVTLN